MSKSVIVWIAAFGSLWNSSDAAFVGHPSTKSAAVRLHATPQHEESFSSSSENHIDNNKNSLSRRELFRHGGSSSLSLLTAGVLAATTNFGVPAAAHAESVDTLVEDLKSAKTKLEQVPDLLQAEKWEQVRTILKTPPVNYLWNMGDGQNTLLKIAKATDEMELIDLKDELSISIQMCDQLTYDNVFVYFQPGNGKVKVKEPVELATKAIKQLADAIELAKGS